MTLKQLKAFLALARTLNYANASAELHLSQSALSLSIKSLEEELGGKLFKRNTRRVELTQEGKSLIPYARKLLANWEDMENDVKQRFKLNRGTLNIASMPFVTHAILPEVIQIFSNAHPNLSFSIHDIPNEKIIENVLDGIFELGICFQPILNEQLEFKALFEEDFLALIPKTHPLASKKSITWQELYANPFITLQHPSIVRYLLEQNASRLGLVLDLKVECHQISTFSSFVALGIGVSAIPRHFQHSIDKEHNVLLEIENSEVQQAVGIIYKKDAELSNISSEFIQTLSNYPYEKILKFENL
ncbi:LysR family transcriptional regulator [Acinetobacter sp. S40]|uniref:LysR family transcriptional regulator n=1 Tax=unclassified Acinetobacter TaxID=196816 RepID=UPI00190C7982|nr:MULTISPECIES: LysR family transcriptional regulator [unclassified Acinetobacter]MBJ9985357.1 LysR family transcriptional regulator [Acinetobacter sp. S40]MBK0063698.1 LysR family transcriptional regulator [Acinetobacter sp. S55]MBK0067013.1 LysR family transcriptional regulator [Acinetobacter sp. S54]